MKKQIEEMAECIEPIINNEWVKMNDAFPSSEEIAKALYRAGYRKQEWISVDRLPEDVYGKDRKQIVVLVHTKSGRISSASRVRMSKWDKTKLEWVELDTFQWSRGLRVTHWMPLPDAPKGGGEG